MNALARLLVALFFTIALAACGAGEGSSPVCLQQGLVGGSPRAEYLALDSRQERAIVRLRISSQTELLGVCAGAWIGDKAVLAARHCTELEGATDTEAVLGAGDEAFASPVLTVDRHPLLDLALLTLADAPGSDAVPLFPGFDVAASEGGVLQITGFETIDARSFAVSSVVALGESSFTVSAGGRAAPCEGDSGAPALVRDASGSVAVIGTLSGGMKSCAGSDDYVPLAAARDWLAARGVVRTTGVPLVDCALLPDSGRCYGSVAVWCAPGDSRSHFDPCSAGKVCGFSPGDAGFRCVNAGADPCDQLGDRGRCDGDQLTRCEAGRVVTSACQQCAAHCRTSVVSGDAICNAE